jgi:hypothetical protein
MMLVVDLTFGASDFLFTDTEDGDKFQNSMQIYKKKKKKKKKWKEEHSKRDVSTAADLVR